MMKHNALVRMPEQDLEQSYKKGKRKQMKKIANKAEFDVNKLRILPNTE